MNVPPNPALRIELLGPPRLTWQGTPLSIPRRQVRALLYRLAVYPHPVSRDLLCALFWPEGRPATARTNLSRLLYLLQQTLPDASLLQRREDHLTLDPNRVWVDTWALERPLAQAYPTLDALREAAGLYRGAFLEGFELPGSGEYQIWLLRERHTWERRFLSLLAGLMEREEQAGHLAQAIQWAQRYLELDELAEPIHRRLIRLYGALGDREAAGRQFARCAEVLARELEVEPLPETRAAYEAALGGQPTSSMRPTLHWRLSFPITTPFVGRGPVLERLHQAFAQARMGRGTGIFIAGEPGIGKTRLLQEFVASLPSNAQPLCVQSDESEQDMPYGALLQGLRTLLPQVDWQGLPVSPTRLSQVARLLPELHRACPGLPPPEQLPPGHESRQLFLALDELFHGLARRHPPLLVCLDNLHWLDHATQDWLSHWLPSIHSRPILVLATYRTEHRPQAEPLRRRLGPQAPPEILLTGLDEDAVQLLVHHLLGNGEAAQTLSRALHRRTGGNPFFLLEILHSLLAGKEPHLDPEAVSRRLDQIPPPTAVEETVRHRLRHLPPQSRHALEAAAVLGVRFSVEALAATSGQGEDQTLDALEDLVARGLLWEEGHTIRFVHELVREQVYREMLHSRRQILHRRAARALQRLTPSDVPTLAHHLQRAGELREATAYWLRAGDQARRLHAYRDAVHHYERALALQQALDDEEGAAHTLLRLGLAHHLAFDFHHAQRSYHEGFERQQRAPTTPDLPPAPRPLRVDWPHLSTLDPGRAQDPNSLGVIEHLFSGLAEWDPNMDVLPDVARGWDILADGRQYVFHLRTDCTWSDGHPVTAQDFVVAWRRVLDPKHPSPLARLLFPIRGAAAYAQGHRDNPEEVGIHALDDLTLLVELEAPCSFFPHLIAHPVARPVPHHRMDPEAHGQWRPDTLVTNGPFRLVEWSEHGRVILSRNGNYRGRWPGNVEDVILYLGLSPAAKEAKWARFRQDSLDVFTLRWGLPPQILAQIRRQHAHHLLSAHNFFVRFLGFDTRTPPFADVRVRRAFALGTDRLALAQVIWGDLVPAQGGLIPPEMPGHLPNPGLTYAPAQARALLAQAGYPRGHGFPELTMPIFPGAESAGAYLQRLWRQVLGVEIGLETLPWDTYMHRIQQGPHPPLFLAGWVADYPDPDSFLRVLPLQAWTGWCHPDYQARVRELMSSRDPEERARLARQADALLMEELPIVPLAYSRWSLVLKPWVRILPVSPLKWWFWKETLLE